jgi:hypothetical protein
MRDVLSHSASILLQEKDLSLDIGLALVELAAEATNPTHLN